MICKHNEVEIATAVEADGLCPLCLAEEVKLLKLELKVLQRAYDQLYEERYGDKPRVVYGHVR